MDSNGNSAYVMSVDRSQIKLELANIATDEKSLLKGFKILGVFPFYLKYIRRDTHIRLCAIKEQIRTLDNSEGVLVSSFYDTDLQKKLQPLVNQYCLTGLMNNRTFSFFIRPFLNRKLRRCGHAHILNIYATIQQLDEPAFFLTYYKRLKAIDHTLLKEA